MRSIDRSIEDRDTDIWMPTSLGPEFFEARKKLDRIGASPLQPSPTRGEGNRLRCLLDREA
jgi:hypothetical protein